MPLNKIIIPTFPPSIRVMALISTSYQVLVRRMVIQKYVYNDITNRLLIISCNNIVLIITTALYSGSVDHVI